MRIDDVIGFGPIRLVQRYRIALDAVHGRVQLAREYRQGVAGDAWWWWGGAMERAWRVLDGAWRVHGACMEGAWSVLGWRVGLGEWVRGIGDGGGVGSSGDVVCGLISN